MKNKSSSSTGLSTFDLLGDIPHKERTMIQLFLRNSTTLTKKELKKIVAKLPEDKQLSPSEIKSTLDKLIEKGWITQNKKTYFLLQQKHQGKNI